MDLKDKKVLLVGLGILGGGLSMAKYLVEKGADLKVTDLGDIKLLEPMMQQLPKSVKFRIGEHRIEDFEEAQVIIFNPAVPVTSDWVKLAQRLKKPYYNDYTFFMKTLETVNPNALVIGITGTRGKTTTSMWTNHLIPGSSLGGNIPELNLLPLTEKGTDVFVLELSSYQLEYATKGTKSPDIAAITNVYIDHLNRYGKAEVYRDIKFKIFENQTEKDALILNADEPVTKEVLKVGPKSIIFYVSIESLKKNQNGMFFDGDQIIYQYKGQKSNVTRVIGLAPHEKSNLLFSMLIAHLAGTDGKEIVKLLGDLPQPKFRQEVILKNRNYLIINDSAATNPDATIAAIEKYKKNKHLVLITGGTNKVLDFKNLAKKIKENIEPENLYLLEGSATVQLITKLNNVLYSTEVVPYQSLEDIVDVISQEYPKATIVFSPASASFEKFKNEFDRGETFNKLIKKYFT